MAEADGDGLAHRAVLDCLRRLESVRERARFHVHDRFERIAGRKPRAAVQNGDAILAHVRDVFYNGLGIKWGEDQGRVFNAFVFSCLPLIYGNAWPENKARVLREWNNAQRECPYTLVVMARRNGKTFVTSGTVAALLRCVPNIKIAIFSTCTRTSYMMMTAIMEMIDKALAIGTHFNEEQFAELKRNMETVEYMCGGTKRILGCFPGSVRVSCILIFLEGGRAFCSCCGTNLAPPP